MMFMEAIRLAVQIFSNICASLLYLSTLPLLRSIAKSGKHNNHSNVPYAAQWLNASLWFAYGLSISDISVAFPNGLGVLTSLNALFILFVVNEGNNKMWIVRNFLLANLAILIIGAIALTSPNTSKIIGYGGVGVAVLMFSAPLVQCVTVIRTRSTKSMSLPLSMVMCFNCTGWIMYSYLVQDLIIFIPNGLGLCLAILQVLVYVFVEAGTTIPKAFRWLSSERKWSAPNLCEEGAAQGPGDYDGKELQSDHGGIKEIFSGLGSGESGSEWDLASSPRPGATSVQKGDASLKYGTM